MFILEFLPSILAVVVAAAVAWISWLQWKTNESRRRQELFDKRYEIFEQTQMFIRETLNGRAQGPVISEFQRLIPKARFLFSKEIAAFMTSVCNVAIDLQPPEGAGSQGDHREGSLENMKWMSRQLGEATERFEPYLQQR